jgi:hypothetical protein
VDRSQNQVDTIRRQLRHVEARREALCEVLAGYEKLAKLDRARRDTKPKGSISLRGAVLQVIKDASSAIKPADIWVRAKQLGAASAAKDPVAICDLMAYQLSKSRPLKKTSEGWSYTE